MAEDANFGDTAMATTVFSGNLDAVKLVVSDYFAPFISTYVNIVLWFICVIFRSVLKIEYKIEYQFKQKRYYR